MRVLFLDIDGVINSLQSDRMHKRNGLDVGSGDKLTPLCPIAISNLKFILELEPNVKVVLSSGWRSKFALQDIADHIGIEIIDKTFNLNTDRGKEIHEWLIRHPEVKKFVILDDCNDMEPYMDHLVQTNFEIGLTIIDAREVARRFRI